MSQAVRLQPLLRQRRDAAKGDVEVEGLPPQQPIAIALHLTQCCFVRPFDFRFEVRIVLLQVLHFFDLLVQDL